MNGRGRAKLFVALMVAALVGLCAQIVAPASSAAPLGSRVVSQDDDADADNRADQPSAAVVTVATKPLEPFVIIDSTEADGRGLRGYSIDVWNEVTDRLDLRTEWVINDTVGEILDGVTNDEVDAAIAGISMTAERETSVDFTHPYFDSGLQVAVRPSNQDRPVATVIGIITSRSILGLIAAMIALTAVMAHLVWWFERRHNAEFPHSYREGIGEALWWSSVSVITGGEAVKDIRRPLSRLLAVGWMIIGLFLIAFVTAQAAASLTVSELQSDISGLEDLPGRTVVTVEGTVAETYLDELNIRTETVSDIDTAMESVKNGVYDAVVYDAPVLAYRVNSDFADQLVLAGSTFAPDPYGIALVTESELREPINEVILEMLSDGTLDALHQKWLGVER